MGKDLNYFFLKRKITRKQLYNFLEPYSTKELVLEIGCGETEYSDLFPNKISIDIDYKKKPDIVADICDLNIFEDNCFMYILCLEVLEHCREPQVAIHEMMRVLKPNGILLFSTRFIYPLHDTPYDYFRFTKYGLFHLFKDYKIIEFREEATTMETIGVLLQRIAFQSKTRTVFDRIALFIKAESMKNYNKLLKMQYGNLRHTGQTDNILVSGYYLVATKEGESDNENCYCRLSK